MSPTGPVIHEIDAAELLEECDENPEETTTEENFLPSEYVWLLDMTGDVKLYFYIIFKLQTLSI